MSDIHDPATSSPFRVLYQLTDEEKDRERRNRVPKGVLHRDAELRRILSEITHPLQLNSLLTYARLDDGSRSPWRIWKGSRARAKTRGSSIVRFILQFARVSDTQAVLIAHYRSDDHDDYQRHQLPRLRAGQRPLAPTPKIPKNPNISAREETPELALIRAVRAPGDLEPRLGGPTLLEGREVPYSLDRHAVADAIRRGVHSRIPTTQGSVSIHPDGYGGAAISIGDEADDLVREYTLSVLDNDDAWDTVRRCAATPDRDPCLVLSSSEKALLNSFENNGTLPLLINGSPGSGKTTLLTLSLAALVVSSRQDQKLQGSSPLFVTYSEELRDRTQERLINALVLLHGWRLTDAQDTAADVCRTFTEIVDGILGTSRAPSESGVIAADLASDEWRRFLEWRGPHDEEDRRNNGRMRPVRCFRALKMFVFGYLPSDGPPSPEDLEDIMSRRKALRDVHDFTEEDLNYVLQVWSNFRLTIGPEGTLADRSVRASEIVSQQPERFCTRGHIIIDEAQDLTEHDIRLLINLSRFSTVGDSQTQSHTGRRTSDIAFPLIIAGDEMQSVSSSGFTFQGTQELIKQVAAELELDLANWPLEIRLTENFRNLPEVADLVTSSRRLISHLTKARHIADAIVYRASEGDGAIEQVIDDRPIDESIRTILKRESSIVIVPCPSERRAAFVAGRLQSIVGDRIEDSMLQGVKTVEACKGLEYDDAILCGFGTAYADLKKRDELSWLLNALVVAVSRARNRVIFLDEPGTDKALFNDLRDLGKLSTEFRQVKNVLISDVSRAKSLISQLSELLTETDPGRPDETALSRLHALLVEVREILSEQTFRSSPLQRLATTEAWATEWHSYLVTRGAPQWTRVNAHPERRLWEWIVDHAITSGSHKTLRSFLKSKPRVTDRSRRRIFSAVCAIAVSPNRSESPEVRLHELGEHLNNLAPTVSERWIYQVSSRYPVCADLWSQVQRTTLAMRGPFKPNVASDIVTLLRKADPSEWLASAVFVMTALPDAATALNRLASERTNLPENIVEILELRSLTEGCGLVWLDEEAQGALIGLLRSGTTTENDIIRAMSLESVRLCAAKQFARVAELSDPYAPHNDAYHSNAQIFAQAAIAALLDFELDGISAQLVKVREKLDAKGRDSRYDQQ